MRTKWCYLCPRAWRRRPVFAHLPIFFVFPWFTWPRPRQVLTMQWRLALFWKENSTEPSWERHCLFPFNIQTSSAESLSPVVGDSAESFRCYDTCGWSCPCKAAPSAPSPAQHRAALTRLSCRWVAGYLLTAHAQELAFPRGDLEAIRAALDHCSVFCSHNITTLRLVIIWKR